MALSVQIRIEQFDCYIKNLIHDLHLEEDEKSELEEEWKQHLYDHYEALLKQDKDKDEAVRIVIEQFGDLQMLQDEVSTAYPNSIKNHIQKEILIAIVCLIASLIGPSLLIGAHFQIYFILAPMQALLIAYLVHRFIIKKLTDWRLSIIGAIIIYLFFLKILPQITGSSMSAQLYFDHLFSLEWNQLTGSNGLFEFVTTHMLWYVVIAFNLLTKENFIPAWKRVLNTSFQYWSMLLLGLFLARFQSSAEWSVLYMNVFLIYSFLQQTVSIKWIKILKEKTSRLLMRHEL